VNNVNNNNNYAVWLIVASMGFRENLKSELAYQDMLVKELAEHTEVISRHTLDNYLNTRRRMPTVDVAVKIRALVQNYNQLSKDYKKMIMEILQLFKNRKRD
jgi:hypothetical protein